ncbi:MAG: hypothetical protein Q7T01_03410 [bacterium]|nr:hypothetical protein [bacterium]
MARKRRSHNATVSRRSPARETVERLYRDRNGNLRDPRRFDRRPPAWRRWTIGGGLVLLVILAIAAWTSFVVFRPFRPAAGDGIALTIAAPPIAAIGSDVSYRITIANEDRVPIAAATLELQLPPGYLLAAAEPAPDDARETRWTLGTIAGNAQMTIELRGHLYGEPGAAANTAATIVYRPSNFNADFEERADATTVLGTSPLALAMDGPTRTVPNETVTYVVTYEHLGEEPLTDVTLRVDVPRSFALTSVEPTRTNDLELAWVLGALAPGDTGTVKLHGRFQTGSPTPHTIRARASIAPSGTALTVASADTVTEVIGGNVMLLATANDQTSSFAAEPGAPLRFRVAVRNDGQEPIRNIAIRAVFDAASVGERSILNYTAMQDAANGDANGEQLAPGLRRGTIVWTAEHIPALVQLAPGAQATLDFTIPVHTATSLPGFPQRGSVQFHTAATIGATGALEKPYTVTTDPMTIEIQRR